MMRALWSAASGMKAQQTHMDIVAHNIANVNTHGGKKVRAEFQDLVYQTLREAGAQNGADSQYPTALQIGLGTRVAATQRVFTQGPLQTTDNPTDIGIQGEGFFRVTMPDGTTAYTRDGTWKLDGDRRMVTTDGYLLADGITIGQNAPSDSITISGDGRVSYREAGQTQQQEAGQITLARFVNPAGLTSIGKNLFVVSDASGEAIESNPGVDGAGTITAILCLWSGLFAFLWSDVPRAAAYGGTQGDYFPTVLSSAQLSALAEQKIEEKLSAMGETRRHELRLQRAASTLRLPAGEVTAIVEFPRGIPYSREFPAVFAVYIDGVLNRRATSYYKVMVYDRVLVAMTDIRAEGAISAANARLEERAVDTPPELTLTDFTRLEGRVAGRYIRKDATITWHSSPAVSATRFACETCARARSCAAR